MTEMEYAQEVQLLKLDNLIKELVDTMIAADYNETIAAMSKLAECSHSYRLQHNVFTMQQCLAQNTVTWIMAG